MFAARGGFLYQQPPAVTGTSGFWQQLVDNYLTTPYVVNLTNWKNASGYTIEYWAYIPSDANLTYLATPQADVPFGPGLWQGGSNYWSFGFSPTLQVQFYYWGSGKYSIGTAASAVTVGTWNNICMSASTSGSTFTMRIFVNGVQQQIRANNTGTYASTYSNTNGAFGSAPFSIGQWGTASNSARMYIDELRVSTTTRYTSNYTPATTAFTSDANTQLLLQFTGTNGSTTITDSSSFARTITNAGTNKVTISNAQGKF